MKKVKRLIKTIIFLIQLISVEEVVNGQICVNTKLSVI